MVIEKKAEKCERKKCERKKCERKKKSGSASVSEQIAKQLKNLGIKFLLPDDKQCFI